MRLYGGKLLKQKTEKRLRQAQEMRDAIVFDVTPASKYCRVKIQGSDTYIKAYYPENWEATPVYLKPGNAVRITHPGGNRGRIEIAGVGFLRPTSSSGQTIIVTPETLVDTVLTGCALSQQNPVALGVSIGSGTYRINEITYTLVGMKMDRTDIVMDRYDLLLDDVKDSAVFDAAHSTQFRYDSVCIGEDGVIDVIKGTGFYSTATTIPDPPVALADHIRLGWVFIPPNTTTITGGLINKYYQVPKAAYIVATLSPSSGVVWGSTGTINLYVKDQYGNNVNGAYTFVINWGRGTGSLSKGDYRVYEPDEFTYYQVVNSFPVTITYHRTEEIEAEEVPLLLISSGDTSIASISLKVTLLDSVGGEIIA